MKRNLLLIMLIILVFPATVFAEIPVDLQNKADQGDAMAQYNIASMYLEGKNTSIDYQQAMKWFGIAKKNLEKLAMENNAQAQFILSNMYGKGYGTPPDDAKKIYWLEKSAENGHSYAQEELAFKYRIEIINDFLNYSIGQGPYIGKGGTIGSRNEKILNQLYWLESRTFKKAIYWNEQSAANGSVTAQYWLGQVYMDVNQEGKPIDLNKAKYWWEQAANQGDLLSALDLGIMYFEGEGGPVDYKKAEYWLRKVEIRKNELANNDKKSLGKMLSTIEKANK